MLYIDNNEKLPGPHATHGPRVGNSRFRVRLLNAVATMDANMV